MARISPEQALIGDRALFDAAKSAVLSVAAHCSDLAWAMVAVVDETDRDRPAGDGTAHAVAEMQRRAARQRRIHRVAIDVADLRGASWLA